VVLFALDDLRHLKEGSNGSGHRGR
jgi:hypothetical protein